MNKDLLKTIFNALAVTMGVAVIVTNIVSPLSLTAITTFLGFGVAALSVTNLQK